MYSQLGDIKFITLFGPDQYDDNRETEFAEVALINRKSRLQRVGEKLQEVNLNISLNHSFCVPEEVYNLMDDKRANAEILPLIWGSGQVEGDFVIRSIKKQITELNPNGSWREIVLQLALIEYYNPDKISEVKKTAQRDAFATSLASPTPENIDTTEPSAATDVMADVSAADRNNIQVNDKLNSAANKTNGYSAPIDKAQVFVNQVKSDSFQVKKLIRTTKEILSGVGVKLAANPALTAIATSLTADITAANVAVTGAETVVNGYSSLPDPVSTLSEANQVLDVMADTVQATNDLEAANKNVQKSAQPLAAAIAARKEF
jgi:phage protein U